MVIETGKPHTKQDSAAHTPGNNQGNSTGNYDKQKGHLPDGKRTAAASTGIDPGKHEPIDPRMPNLPPP
jgi:hypothetical protein